MKEKVEAIRQKFDEQIKNINSLKELNDLKIEYVGKKGPIAELTSMMREVEDKKTFGMILNELRTHVSNKLDELKEKFEQEELNKKLESEAIDITLPATQIPTGAPSILEKVIEDFEEVFMSMGYDVVDGPELEEDKFNFELLGLPKGHPARDAQDTFYVKGDELLLRSHTSPVQARVMLSKEGK